VSIPSESSLPLGLLFQKFIAEMPSGAPYSRHIALKIPRHLSVRVTAFRTNPAVAIKRRVCAEYSQLQGHRWKRWTNGTAAFQMVETPPEARGALGANRLQRAASTAAARIPRRSSALRRAGVPLVRVIVARLP
jgi:hypothetical protein